LNIFRYIGTPDKESFELPFLGLHGKYELCNGSRDYKDWCKKLKFLGYKSVGICEYQTLAAAHYFQDACEGFGLKPIHGRTCKIKAKNGTHYYVKLFVKNEIGWKNLVKIHNTEIILREDAGECITEEELKSLSEG